MTGVNAARGETALNVAGHTWRLCLTLGALAEIESLLEVDNVADVSPRLARLSASGVLKVLAALVRGGGATISDAQVAALPLTPAEAAQAVASAFKAAGDA